MLEVLPPHIVLGDFGSGGLRIIEAKPSETDPKRIVISRLEDLEFTFLGPLTTGDLTSTEMSKIVGMHALATTYSREIGATKVEFYGTESLRRANNFAKLNEYILHNEFPIQIITGTDEATAIAHAASYFLKDHMPEVLQHSVFFGKIGTGSCEFGWIENSIPCNLISVPYGSIELSGMIEEKKSETIAQKEVLSGAKKSLGSKKVSALVFCGGVIRELDKLNQKVNKKSSKYRMTASELDSTIQILETRSFKSLTKDYSVREDRAPRLLACALELKACMKAAKVNEVIAPDCGFREGKIIELSGLAPLWGAKALSFAVNS